MALTRSTDPLVWIDCEMTGLNSQTDSILSLSCIITDHLLEPFPHLQPYNAIIHHSPERISTMNEWCIHTHTASGLVQSCITSTTTHEQAANELYEYITTAIPSSQTALLAGNSIHADRAFLAAPGSQFNRVLGHLHYRLFDVSAMKEMVRRWCRDEILAQIPTKELKHTAENDVRESIEEAKFYMQLLTGTGFIKGHGINARGEASQTVASEAKEAAGEKTENGQGLGVMAGKDWGS